MSKKQFTNKELERDLTSGVYPKDQYAFTLQMINDGRGKYWELRTIDSEAEEMKETYTYYSQRDANRDLLLANAAGDKFTEA